MLNLVFPSCFPGFMRLNFVGSMLKSSFTNCTMSVFNMIDLLY